MTDDSDHGINTPVEELGVVGGWFGIRRLQYFLASNAPIERHKTKHADGDVTHTPLFDRALIELQKVVPNPPVKASALEVQLHFHEQIQIWQEWISAHKDELSKLQPTGEGVDFSLKACKNGKPVKRH